MPIILEVSRLQLTSLLSIVLDRYLESEDPKSDSTVQWEDVVTGEIVTIRNLLELLARKVTSDTTTRALMEHS